MPCYKPWLRYRLANGELSSVERGDVVSTVTIPCGWCVGCRLEKAQEWAIRILHEVKLYGPHRCCWPTLTYDAEHLPPGGSLVKEDPIRFIDAIRKRLRRAGEVCDVRYFGSGEYGLKLFRPHYHVCLMGFRPDDLREAPKSRRGSDQMVSDMLTEIWGKGRVTVGELNEKSAGYTARYSMKKVYGKEAIEYYARVDPETGEVFHLLPEFAFMSTRPAIGKRWAERFESDFFVGSDGMVVVNGREVKAPRYYLRKWAERNPEAAEDLKLLRLRRAQLRFSDNTDERLAVKEVVKLAQIRALSRSFVDV